jgi:hypothetical protein
MSLGVSGAPCDPSCVRAPQLGENIAKPSTRRNNNLLFILLYTSFSAIIIVLDKLLLDTASHEYPKQL